MDTKEIIKADAKVSANTVNEIYKGCFTRKGQIKKLFGAVSQGRCPNMASERETTLPKKLVGFFREGKFNTGVCSFVTFASLLVFLFWWLLVSSIIFFGFLCKVLLCSKLQLFIDKIHTTNSGRFRK